LSVAGRTAKSKIKKPGVFRKKTGVDQEIFDTKSGEKLGDIFIEIMKQFRGCVSKKTAIFVNMSVCYYLLLS
jgi:hypothetical protein